LRWAALGQALARRLDLTNTLKAATWWPHPGGFSDGDAILGVGDLQSMLSYDSGLWDAAGAPWEFVLQFDFAGYPLGDQERAVLAWLALNDPAYGHRATVEALARAYRHRPMHPTGFGVTEACSACLGGVGVGDPGEERACGCWGLSQPVCGTCVDPASHRHLTLAEWPCEDARALVRIHTPG
jgi:hypothetical protein